MTPPRPAPGDLPPRRRPSGDRQARGAPIAGDPHTGPAATADTDLLDATASPGGRARPSHAGTVDLLGPTDPTDPALADVDDADDAGPGPQLPPLPARRRRPPRSAPKGLWRVGAAASILLAWGATVYGAIRPAVTGETSAWGIAFLPIMAVLALAVVHRAAARETRFDLLGIALTGFGLRCAGAFVRFNAPVDALVYNQEGSRIAPDLRSLDFFVDTGREIPGTGWIRYVSGLTHAFVLDDMYTSFLLFTFLAFVGTFLVYTAFARAVPTGDHKRYALLVFLWPSLLYWPSSIGKEAWMIFGLGVACAGISHTLTSSWLRGMVLVGTGVVLLSLVRPHIALMVMIGFGVSLLVRPGKASIARTAGRIIAIALLLVGGAIVAGKTAELLKVDSTGTEGVTTALEETVLKTAQGGAAFKPPIVRSPVDYPIAFTTVWFRPFPFEARGGGGESAITQLLSSAENMFLLALLALSWRRLWTLPRALVRIPYITFATTFILVFAYAFAVVGNFGILARQRTQGILVFFVLLCPPVVHKRAARVGPRDAADEGRARRAEHQPTRAAVGAGPASAPDGTTTPADAADAADGGGPTGAAAAGTAATPGPPGPPGRGRPRRRPAGSPRPAGPTT